MASAVSLSVVRLSESHAVPGATALGSPEMFRVFIADRVVAAEEVPYSFALIMLIGTTCTTLFLIYLAFMCCSCEYRQKRDRWHGLIVLKRRGR